MESREELIERAERGREIEEFVSNRHIKAVFDDTLALARNEMASLDPTQQREWTILQSSIQAVERMWNGLSGWVQVGRDAEAELLKEDDERIEAVHKGIL